MHQDNLIGNLQRLFRIMGNNNCGGAGLLQNFDGILPDLVTQAMIEIGKRFIHQEHLRFRCQGTGQGHALLLATRQGIGITVQMMLHRNML